MEPDGQGQHGTKRRRSPHSTSFHPRDQLSSFPSAPTSLRLPLSLGYSNFQLIYTLPLLFGSPSPSSPPQTLSLQIDTGSSDLWVASTNCTADVCAQPGVNKFDIRASASAVQTGETFSVAYLIGSASGPIISDTVTVGTTDDDAANGVGGLTIPSQAFAACDHVTVEQFSTAHFSGILGLALPGNSIIQNVLGGRGDVATIDEEDAFMSPNRTGAFVGSIWQALLDDDAADSDDGSDNGSSASSTSSGALYFSVGLQRPGALGGMGDSVLTVGTLDAQYATTLTDLTFSSVPVALSGYPKFWRLPMTSLNVDWQGGTHQIALHPSVVSDQQTVSAFPLAVFDTGGTNIFGPPQAVNDLYRVWGISQSADGNYYVPCTLAQQITVCFGGSDAIQVPLHPLDMSVPTPNGSGERCIGAFQALPGDPTQSPGDFIMGTAFMRAAYSVFSCSGDLTVPSTESVTSSCQASVGLRSMQNASQMLDEFNRVRVLHEDLKGTAPNPSGSPDFNIRRGLSAGAKVGIGISIGVAFMAVVVFLSFYFSSRRAAASLNMARRKFPLGVFGKADSGRGGVDVASDDASEGIEEKRSRRQMLNPLHLALVGANRRSSGGYEVAQSWAVDSYDQSSGRRRPPSHSHSAHMSVSFSGDDRYPSFGYGSMLGTPLTLPSSVRGSSYLGSDRDRDADSGYFGHASALRRSQTPDSPARRLLGDPISPPHASGQASPRGIRHNDVLQHWDEQGMTLPSSRRLLLGDALLLEGTHHDERHRALTSVSFSPPFSPSQLPIMLATASTPNPCVRPLPIPNPVGHGIEEDPQSQSQSWSGTVRHGRARASVHVEAEAGQYAEPPSPSSAMDPAIEANRRLLGDGRP